jgi:hypothetical protein
MMSPNESFAFKRDLLVSYFPTAISEIILRYGSCIYLDEEGRIKEEYFTTELEQKFSNVLFLKFPTFNRLVYSSYAHFKVSFDFDNNKKLDMLWNNFGFGLDLLLALKFDEIEHNNNELKYHIDSFASILEIVYNNTVFHDIALTLLLLIRKYKQNILVK